MSTLSIWLSVEWPGNMGFPVSSSPSKQPKLHTSADFEYFFEPSSTYGARYQRVAMYSVSAEGTSSSSSTDLTSPKSQILARHS